MLVKIRVRQSPFMSTKHALAMPHLIIPIVKIKIASRRPVVIHCVFSVQLDRSLLVQNSECSGLAPKSNGQGGQLRIYSGPCPPFPLGGNIEDHDA